MSLKKNLQETYVDVPTFLADATDLIRGLTGVTTDLMIKPDSIDPEEIKNTMLSMRKDLEVQIWPRPTGDGYGVRINQQ
ncbi:hypothetical protein KBD69_03680 [Candidatus Woesebacteria bacterium]|nr:hypothetical protein [Candidatus Woesebacteria bacterium]